MAITELRLVLTVKDFDRATAFFRDALGLKQLAAWQNDGGHVVLLDAGHATLEIADEAQAQAIDRIEVGRRVAGPVRIAFQTPVLAAAAHTAADDLHRGRHGHSARLGSGQTALLRRALGHDPDLRRHDAAHLRNRLDID